MARNANFVRPEEHSRQAPSLRYGAQDAKNYLTNQKYERDPNKETFVARPGRGASGESSN
jgi:hypothetical protein